LEGRLGLSEFEIVTLRSGPRAVKELASGEIMHPAIGPWAEANHLYVEQSRLVELLQRPASEPLRIYDVGLGGAANAAAALSCASALGSAQARALEIVSFDRTLEPLRLALGNPDAFPFLVPFREAAERLAERRAWEGPRARWQLRLGDALEQLDDAPAPADSVFFDPFSPKANPDLWTLTAFRALRSRLGANGLLITYSASTAVRVTLLLAGFFVGAGVGVGAKGETTVAATGLDALRQPLGARWLARWSRSPKREPLGNTEEGDVEGRLRAHPQFR
jgi:tRNA U34 5-methylaminomethyl-2-thiouridine-forming methyltransferase MnmC